MELKDIILSTLAELEETPKDIMRGDSTDSFNNETQAPLKMAQNQPLKSAYETKTSNDNADLVFLQNMRERILVLFEGFQSPNNKNIEAKIDLTLNFLEYLLASIDEHLEKTKKPLLP